MPAPQQPSLIVRQKSPPNMEFPFASLAEWVVPTDLFFVRNHFPSPDLDAREWRLRVDGAVERPIELDLDSVKAMRSTTLAAVVECAGNGRVYYEPPKEGLQWQNGAVGNATWTGVPLREILEMAGVKPTATEVLFVGADTGLIDFNKKTASPGPIAFARSLPLKKAVADSTILAYAMNEAPLTRDHGYPLRAVVGGWFGMAWVKWITHIRVMEQPFLGYWQARDYFRWDRSAGEPALVPLSEMEVKAQIARPATGRVSLSANNIGYSAQPGAARRPSSGLRSAPETAKAGVRQGFSARRSGRLRGGCGSRFGRPKAWGNTRCDVALSIGRCACNPTTSIRTARATPPIGSFRSRSKSFRNRRRTKRTS